MEERGIIAAKNGKRAMERIGKAVHTILMEYWHKHILERHFKRGAGQKYGYKPRSESYIKRRARRWGMPVEQNREYDLAFSGAMRRDLKSFATPRAFPTRFSLTMKGPKHVGMRPMGGSNMPNLGEEATRVIEDEMREMIAEVDRALPELVAAEGDKVTHKETIR